MVVSQEDSMYRVVALENLEAMCDRISGVYTNQFWVEKVTPSRVHVGFSNEDEYAHRHDMFAILPIFPSTWGEQGNPRVLLHIVRIIGEYKNWGKDYAYQAFEPLMDCPILHRDPKTLMWYTKEEIVDQLEGNPLRAHMANEFLAMERDMERVLHRLLGYPANERIMKYLRHIGFVAQMRNYTDTLKKLAITFNQWARLLDRGIRENRYEERQDETI